MTEMESKERINPNERLNLCLTNLFQGPSQGIEKAFNFILELLEKQQKEHDELKSAHAEFDTRNKELVANLKREFEESNEIIQKKFEVENEQLKECVEAIRKERDDLLKDNVDIRAKQSSFENLLYDMKKEVKTMAYNLQLGTVPEDDSNEDEIEDICEENVDDAHEESNNKDDTREEVINGDDGDLTNNSDSSEIDCENENTIVDETSSVESNQKSETKSQEESSSTIPDTIIKKSFRRASVASRKLQVHETLAARLDRIESDKEQVKRDLIDLKSLLENSHPQSESTTVFTVSEESILEVHQRLISLEKFLAGFGVTKMDVSEENDDVEEISSFDNDNSVNQLNSTNNQESITVLTKRKHCSDEEEEEKEEKSLLQETKSDDLDSEESISENDSSTSDAMKEIDNDKEEIISKKSEEVNQQDEVPANNNNFISSDTKQAVESIQVQTNDTVNALEEHNSFVNNRSTKLRSKKSFDKSHGLLKHLLEQEKNFKENLNSILIRLMSLEKEIKTRVGRRSLENILAEIPEEPSIETEYVDNNDVATTNFDDSILTGQIEELKTALEALRNEIDSKVSQTSFMNELEHLRSNNMLTKIEETNTENGNIDDGMLKQLQHMIQNEINFLRKHKLDKEAFTKEMEESKSHLMNTVTKSLSNQETKMMNSLTKVEIDVNDCKESIKILENSIEAKYNDGEDMVNLDEKIKNATDAMESNFQEIISQRLSCLKAMEDEVERVALGLAEKPDQEQINVMLQNLQKAVSQRGGSDEPFKSMLQSMKAELNQKMTRNEVIFFIKQILNGAKEDVRRGEGSLMIGHSSYKCLGCDEVHHRGVNNTLAPKVNHSSLPRGRGLMPAVYPYCTAVGKLGRGALRPLQRSQRSLDSLRGQSRRWASSGKKYTRQSR